MLRLDSYKLKWIAIICMVLFHIIYPWQDTLPLNVMIPLSIAGGATFPIMAYFIVEGYKHTSSLKGYMKRLAIFGLISMPFHFIVFGMMRFNIMFTIIVSLFCLVLYDNIKSKPVFWALFILISNLTALFFDWFAFGPLIVLLYYIIKNETARRLVPGIVAGVLWFLTGAFTLWGLNGMYAMYEMGGAMAVNARFGIDMIHSMIGNAYVVESSMYLIIGSFIGALLVYGYNGERGKRMKWLFYSFYPIHLAALCLLPLFL